MFSITWSIQIVLISELVLKKKKGNYCRFVCLPLTTSNSPIFAGDPDTFLILKNGHFLKGPPVRGPFFGWC